MAAEYEETTGQPFEEVKEGPDLLEEQKRAESMRRARRLSSKKDEYAPAASQSAVYEERKKKKAQTLADRQEVMQAHAKMEGTSKIQRERKEARERKKVRAKDEAARTHKHPEIAVTVVRASALPKMDLLGSCDAYVKIFGPGGAFHKTRTVRNSLDPVWPKGEHATFAVPPGVETLSLEVWDHDLLSADDLVGNCDVPLSCAFRPKEDHTFELKNATHAQAAWLRATKQRGGAKKKGPPTITLRLRWVDDAEPDEKAASSSPAAARRASSGGAAGKSPSPPPPAAPDAVQMWVCNFCASNNFGPPTCVTCGNHKLAKPEKKVDPKQHGGGGGWLARVCGGARGREPRVAAVATTASGTPPAKEAGATTRAASRSVIADRRSRGSDDWATSAAVPGIEKRPKQRRPSSDRKRPSSDRPDSVGFEGVGDGAFDHGDRNALRDDASAVGRAMRRVRRSFDDAVEDLNEAAGAARRSFDNARASRTSRSSRMSRDSFDKMTREEQDELLAEKRRMLENAQSDATKKSRNRRFSLTASKAQEEAQREHSEQLSASLDKLLKRRERAEAKQAAREIDDAWASALGGGEA